MRLFIPQIFVAALVTLCVGEPPAPSLSYGLPSLSHSYGVPEVSYEHSYAPAHTSNSHYVEQHVGHQTSEGLHLDSNLLHKIRDVLIHHENSGSKIVTAPHSAYGVPQSTYGVPSHWSQVVGIDFGHLRQSEHIAHYKAEDRYAPSHGEGWNSGWQQQSIGWKPQTSGWKQQSAGWQPQAIGWSAGNSGWKQQNSGWKQQTVEWKPQSTGWTSNNAGWNSGWVQPSKPIAQWTQPISSGWTLAKPAAWVSSKPSSSYGLPRWWKPLDLDHHQASIRLIWQLHNFFIKFLKSSTNKSHRFIRKFGLVSWIASSRWFNASYRFQLQHNFYFIFAWSTFLAPAFQFLCPTHRSERRKIKKRFNLWQSDRIDERKRLRCGILNRQLIFFTWKCEWRKRSRSIFEWSVWEVEVNLLNCLCFGELRKWRELWWSWNVSLDSKHKIWESFRINILAAQRIIRQLPDPWSKAEPC